MTPGVFVAYVADTLGEDQSKLMVIHRCLHESGRFSKGGRGRNAPHVTRNDAAILLLSICANHCGMTIEKAVDFAANESDWLRLAETALQLGQGFGFHRKNSAGLMLACSVPPWMIQAISNVTAAADVYA